MRGHELSSCRARNKIPYVFASVLLESSSVFEALGNFIVDTLHLYTRSTHHLANLLLGRSYYCVTPSLSPSVYASLISRGFRRSGTLLYKPDLKHSCCAQYTIRLEASKFHPTKDQRQAINRFNHFIQGDEYIRAKEKIRPKSKEEAKRYKQTFDLAERIHEAESSYLGPPLIDKKGEEIKPAHKLDVAFEPDTFTEEKYLLFENYQRNVHHEKPGDISRAGFKRFLCESPLQRTTETWTDAEGKERSKKLGSYHQTYRLDGRLVAMAVLDLLPKVVSGVYFLYHEDLHKWSPGKLSALREASLAVEEGYDFYWMGYYIHSCVKMRYKGDYQPMEFLDPETHDWHLLDDKAKDLMEEKNYICPSREQAKGASDGAPAANGTAPGAKKDDENMGEDADSDYEPDSVDGTVWDNDMPGIMPKEEVATMDIGSVKLSLRGQPALCEDVVVWDRGSLDDPTALKCWIGELVACVGPEVAEEMVVKF